MTYMENLPQRVHLQICEDGQWVTLESNIGLGGYLAYLRMAGDKPGYRVIDGQGQVVPNVWTVLSEEQ